MILNTVRLINALTLVLTGVVLCLSPSSIQAQMFVDEALERGVEAYIPNSGLGGSGLSTVDFDQDGDDDLTLGNNNGIMFFENNDGQFSEIDLNVENPPGEVRAVVWADINNDGNLDLIISAYTGEVRLYKNLGDLEFEDITESSGIAYEDSPNWGISFSDWNRDGFLDFQLCRYIGFQIIPEDPSIDPFRWSRFYQNNGDETFTDVTGINGLVINPGTVFQGVFFDFNNDLWPDNYTIVDRTPGNHLFENNEGFFTDITDDYGVSFPSNDFMSNSISDYNNDGFLDIFMTNGSSATTSTHLLQNNQGESFTDVTQSAGVEVFDFCWGAVWIDADNDGWRDLYFGQRVSEPNYFFINNQGVFEEANDELDYTLAPSYSADKGDFNNDGYYDLVVQGRSPDRSLLLMNQGGNNNYIKITPHGTVSNSMAVGSWVKVYLNDDEFVHFTLCGENYISQSSQHLIFGLGAGAPAVDSVKITYPSGHTDSYYELITDSAYHFYEGETFQANIFAADTALCSDEETVLDAGDFASFSWNTGDTTRFLTINEAGLYTVNVTNEFGVTTQAQIEIDLLPNPIVDETITPNPCNGDSLATITLANLLEVETESVSWSNGMEGLVIDSLPQGTYTYAFTDVSGCIASDSVSIIDPPGLLVFAETNPSDEGEENGSIDLALFGGVPPYVIVLDKDTVQTSIDNLAVGSYTISITDAYGCVEIITSEIGSTLNTTENDLPAIKLFPNPSEGDLKLETLAPISSIRVLSASGALIKDFPPTQHDIDLRELSSGLYILRVEFENSGVYHAKVIKQ